MLQSKPDTAAAQIADDLPACQAAAVDLASASPGCNDLQVILLIDSSASMTGADGNDPYGLRFFGVGEVADILAAKYLESAAAGVLDLPELHVSAVHFGSAVPPQFLSGWIRIAPESQEQWDALERSLVVDALAPEEAGSFIPRVYPATNFINPFRAAADLAETLPGPGESGCPNRVVLVLTDGAPATSITFTGARLLDHMATVRTIVDETFSTSGDEVYVTAISTGEDYWAESRRLWEEITSNAESGAVLRTERVPDATSLASRMANIIATKVGLQIQVTEAGRVFIPPFLASVRISYFAPAAEADLIVDGPFGNRIVPDGDRVTLSGAETATKVIEIFDPAPGEYALTTTMPGGTINLIFAYAEQAFLLVNTSQPLQQFTEGELSFTVLTEEGKPIEYGEDYAPRFEVSIHAQGMPASVSEQAYGGADYAIPISPIAGGPLDAAIRVIGTDELGRDCLLGAGGLSTIVHPVSVVAAVTDELVCTPSGMPVTLTLQIVNTASGLPATLSFPVDWAVTSTSDTGSPVSSSITETGGPSTHLVSLSTETASTLTTTIRASIFADGQELVFFDEVFTHVGLVQDRRYAFELLDAGEPVDERTIRLNDWYEPVPTRPGDLLAVGADFPGEPSDQFVTVRARYFDEQTGAAVPGMERFTLSVLDQEGSLVFGPSTAWETGPDGISSMTFSSPGAGRYQLAVADRGMAAACLTVAPAQAAALSLLTRGRENLVWIGPALLLVAAAIAVTRWWLVCTSAPALRLVLDSDLTLESAPTDAEGYILADLPRGVRMHILENPRTAVRKLQARNGKVHVFIEIEGFVENRFVCSQHGHPILQAAPAQPLPIRAKPDVQSQVLLLMRQSGSVSVLERLHGWDRVQVTVIGYVNAAFATRLEGSYRRCYLPPLRVRVEADSVLSSAPLPETALETLRFHTPAELTVLEDERDAMRKTAADHGWLAVQTRLAGYVHKALAEEHGETLIRVPPGEVVTVFEFSGGKGDILATLHRTSQASLLERFGDWEKVEVRAQGYLPSEKAHSPSRPEGLLRPDRPGVPPVTLPVNECEPQPPAPSADMLGPAPDSFDPNGRPFELPSGDQTAPDREEPEKPQKDDLKLIEGIGPKVEALLHRHGVTTFAQLAARTPSPEQIQQWVDAEGWYYMLTETWPQQAALAADGLWVEFEALVRYLKAGRRQ